MLGEWLTDFLLGFQLKPIGGVYSILLLPPCVPSEARKQESGPIPQNLGFSVVQWSPRHGKLSQTVTHCFMTSVLVTYCYLDPK